MVQLAIEYFVFVFIASLGVLQWAVTRGGLKGLWFFTKPWRGYFFGALTSSSSFAWFFLGKDRSIPGLEGLQQFFLFGLACMASILATVVISSLKNKKRFSPQRGKVGMEALQGMTYFQALRQGLEERDDRG